MDQELSKKLIENRKLFSILLLIVFAAGLNLFWSSADPINHSQGLVTAYLPGASSLEMEHLVVDLIEEKLKDIKDYDYIYSQAQKEMAWVEFKLREKQATSGKWQQVHEVLRDLQEELPAGLQLDFETKFSREPDFIISIWQTGNQNAQLLQMTKELKKQLTNRLAMVEFKLWSTPDLEVLVKVQQDRLGVYHHLSYEHIITALKNCHNGFSWGIINNQEQVTSFSAPKVIQTTKDLEETIIYTSALTGQVVKLKDIATVSIEPKEKSSIANHDGEQAIFIQGYLNQDQELTRIKQQVEQVLESMRTDTSFQLTLEEVSQIDRQQLSLLELRTEQRLSYQGRKGLIDTISAYLADQGLNSYLLIANNDGPLQIYYDAEIVDWPTSLLYQAHGLFREPTMRIGIVGPINQLPAMTEDAKSALSTIPGVLQAYRDYDGPGYEYFLDIDYQKGNFLGFNPSYVQNTIQMATTGQVVNSLIIQGLEYDLRVIGDCQGQNGLLNIPLGPTKNGQRAFLKEIAELKVVPGQPWRQRYNGQQIKTIAAEVTDGIEWRTIKPILLQELKAKGWLDFELLLLP